MSISEIRSKSKEELRTVLSELNKRLFSLKLQKASRQLSKTHELKVVRRDIARVLTVMGGD